MTKYRTIPSEEVFATYSPERQTKIKARAAELIAEELALRDLRKARQLTQEDVAKKLGGKQVYVSRLEKRSDMKLSTLRKYVRAIGGAMEIVITFPKGKAVRLKRFGESQRVERRSAKRG